MNLDLKLEFPVQALVDSLMSCGNKVREEISNISPETQPLVHAVVSASASRTNSPEQSSGSESVSTTCDPVRKSAEMHGSSPFPRFESPYRQKGKWQTNQATYFLRVDSPPHSSSPAVPFVCDSKPLSANAPVFTPLSSHNIVIPNSSPFMASACSDYDVWELPGLPSPLLEYVPTPEDKKFSPIVHSILERGLSSVVIDRGQPSTPSQSRRQM
jgi:hypothetical protein